jgi:hypothetical protein
MARIIDGIIVGRLFGWPDFAEDGREVWAVHIGDPPFFLRVVHRDETYVPSGELWDVAFPLETDSRFALGNLMFLEPRSADPRSVASLVAGAIAAIHQPEVAARLSLDALPFDPASAEILPEDVPIGTIAGVLYDPDDAAIDPAPWIVHVGPPPFAMRVCDLNEEDLEQEDVWASVAEGDALAHLSWLSSLACDRDDLRSIAETIAEMLREDAFATMPRLHAG